MTTIDGLRPIHVTLLTALKGYQAEHGKAPTCAELSEILGVRRTTVSVRLGVLEARGYLTRVVAGRWRGQITLRDKAHAFAFDPDDTAREGKP